LDLVFSFDTRHKFAGLLRDLIDNEVRNEGLRQKLNRRPLFNVYEAFKALDKFDLGSISIEDFKGLLFDHGIYATSKDLLGLVEKFDKNEDGKVTYSEFAQELAPRSPSRIVI